MLSTISFGSLFFNLIFINSFASPSLHQFIHTYIPPTLPLPPSLPPSPSIRSSVRLFIDSETEKGVPECYTQLNIAGSQSGNCGARDGQYVACAPEHAQCGQLMCDGGRFQFNELSGLSVRTNAETVTSDSVTQTCSSFTLPPAADTVSPGLVPDGTRCGNESVSSGFIITTKIVYFRLAMLIYCFSRKKTHTQMSLNGLYRNFKLVEYVSLHRETSKKAEDDLEFCQHAPNLSRGRGRGRGVQIPHDPTWIWPLVRHFTS